MADVFISYKREDRAAAERVDKALRARGWSTWWDTSLVAGEHFNEAIDRELAAARCVVVIWSEASRKSRWVNAEAVSGFDRGILVSCRIDDVALSYPFSVVQTADLRRGGVDGISDGVHAALNASGQAAAPKQEQEAPAVASDINFGGRRTIGWSLLSALALFSCVALLLAETIGGNWANFSIIFGYPSLGGVGSMLVGSGHARRKIASVWWQILIASGLAGFAAMGLAFFLFFAVSSQIFVWAFLLPPMAAGLAALALSPVLKRRGAA